MNNFNLNIDNYTCSELVDLLSLPKNYTHNNIKQAQESLKEKISKNGILDNNKNEKGLVYITIAGRSNALSGFVAANSTFPTLACPPFSDKSDMLVNIHSTLQMPSNTPVLTIIDPGNCALAVKRILSA